MLDILAAERVPATFFVLGSNVERHPEIVRRARDEGHAVGIHGMNHTKLAGAAAETIERQVGGLTRLLQNLGVTPAPVYRTPHGFKSRGVFEVARRHQLTLWAWSRGVWDTDRPHPAVLVRRATRSGAPRHGAPAARRPRRRATARRAADDRRAAGDHPRAETARLRIRPGRGRVKVGLLCENYFPTLGGEQEHIFNLRRHLERPADGSDPIDVRVIVPHVDYDEWRGPADDDHVIRPAHSLRVHGEGSASQITITPRAYGALRRLFARERFDLLHIHAPVDLGLCAWALWTFDGPIVGTIHSYFSHTRKRHLLGPWYRYVMRRMTRVIAVSEAARDAMARYARFDSTIIGNGVDCDAFAAGRPIERFADGMTNILSVARLEPRNGIDLIIDAFALLARDRPELRLLLAGDGPSRPEYEAQVRRLAAGHGIARAVSRRRVAGAP